MTILLARLRQAARWFLASLGATITILAVYFLRRQQPRKVQDADIHRAIENARHARELASAKAAVEIAAARAVAGQERDELLAALAEEDEEVQARRLIAQAKRLRGE